MLSDKHVQHRTAVLLPRGQPRRAARGGGSGGGGRHLGREELSVAHVETLHFVDGSEPAVGPALLGQQLTLFLLFNAPQRSLEVSLVRLVTVTS